MEVLSHPSFNAYLSGVSDGTLFVIEDADLYVAKREDGNSKMSALLNAISGITKSNIKFLIATNLPTLRHVDPALYRPGRAFRVMEFDKLNAEEAVAARASYNLPQAEFPEGKYTLAEIINREGQATRSFRTGFIK
jgi:SpoVK/Ycf46/Vps4 family AAA+-type ATPase